MAGNPVNRGMTGFGVSRQRGRHWVDVLVSDGPCGRERDYSGNFKSQRKVENK